MAAHESLGEQFGPHMSMLAEAVRRDTARQYGIPHDAPNAPHVSRITSADEYSGAKYHPEASHHITVTMDNPDPESNRIKQVNHVYGVNTSNEYMHNHTIANIDLGGRATTRWVPG